MSGCSFWKFCEAVGTFLANLTGIPYLIGFLFGYFGCRKDLRKETENLIGVLKKTKKDCEDAESLAGYAYFKESVEHSLGYHIAEYFESMYCKLRDLAITSDLRRMILQSEDLIAECNESMKSGDFSESVFASIKKFLVILRETPNYGFARGMQKNAKDVFERQRMEAFRTMFGEDREKYEKFLVEPPSSEEVLAFEREAECDYESARKASSSLWEVWSKGLITTEEVKSLTQQACRLERREQTLREQERNYFGELHSPSQAAAVSELKDQFSEIEKRAKDADNAERAKLLKVLLKDLAKNREKENKEESK